LPPREVVPTQEEEEEVNFYRNILFPILNSTEAMTFTVSRIQITWFKSYKGENRNHESPEDSFWRDQLLKDCPTE